MDLNLYKENIIHGTYSFPLKVYYFNIPASFEETLRLHWHNELEFFHIIEGKTRFQVGSSYIEVIEGQAIFINSTEIHGAHRLNDSKCNYHATVFNIDFLSSKNYDDLQNEFIAPLLKQVSPYIHITGNTSWEKEILTQLSIIETEFKLKSYGFQLKIKICLYNILYSIYTNITFEDEPELARIRLNKMDRLKKILEYIHTNYSQKLDSGTLANLIDCTEEHFRRFFKTLLGKTPVDYINYYRVGIAADLLKNTNDRVIDIAMKTGFENVSYFIRVFKKITKLTPHQYRKKLKANN